MIYTRKEVAELKSLEYVENGFINFSAFVTFHPGTCSSLSIASLGSLLCALCVVLQIRIS